MAQHSQTKSDLLQKPLYIFDLPEELLLSLTIKSNQIIHEPETTSPVAVEERPETPATTSKGTACNLCASSFPTLQDQRDHVRSDLHSYNLKQKLKGLKPVNEPEFESLVGDLSSISGSESEETDSEEEGKDSTLVNLLKKQAKITVNAEDEGQGERRLGQLKTGAGNAPLVWFESPSLPRNTSLGVYKAIFSKAEVEAPTGLADALRRRQIPSTTSQGKAVEGVSLGKKSPHYFLCMIGGGHFAAMIISVAPKLAKKNHERQADVLAHKTFHRYTTRRKQGGGQSSNDNAKGAANSAGAQIRRYNEVALQQEVRALLTEWKSLIDTAELIFVRATGNTNRNTLFGEYEERILRLNDPRNRGFPFTTRRATQAELMRAFVELTRVKISHLDEAALAAAAAEHEKQQASKAASSVPKKAAPPKLTEEEETATMHTTQLQTLIKRSKAPALLNYLKSNTLSPDFAFYPLGGANHHSPTLLHLAASSASPALVTTLLTKANADPTIKNGDGKTAYEIAGDRATRDAFRLARHSLGESKSDWETANVGSALSPEDVAKRTEEEKKEKAIEDKREAERRKGEVEKLKKQEAERETQKIEGRLGKGKSLGVLESVAKKGAERREEEGRGMTPEMRMRLERERRARAAEARMGGGS
ncbi:hypothetical protein EG328_006036 [Venturia inaequalis]|uniref:VLRF1 domain-containing protein n=1 Tax=Venturia inaequalis TaxID=5025 RepID=A0A8H3Z5N9_VENIN|nr:hypothetical protein EG328_006036 [Venturia inaequalis]